MMEAWVLKGPLPAGWEQDVEKSWAKVLSWEPVPEKPLPPKWVRIQVAAAALNRRDAWIVAGLYPRIQYPAILGSDGAGWVVATGPETPNRWENKLVLINPSLEWGSDERVQGEHYHILGMPTPGTFATHVDVPASQVYEAPPGWSPQEAAALPLAGLTAYRALFVQGKLKAGEKVLIPGIGGGVALWALQLAVAAGAEVWVTTSTPEKLQIAQQLGASGGVLYTEEDWVSTLRKQAGSFDLIVDGVVGEVFQKLFEELLAPAGRYVIYGATRGNPPRLDVRRLFWRQQHLIGSTMGSPTDFENLLNFVQQNRIRPYIGRVYPAKDLSKALVDMWRGQQIGKLVLDFAAT
jgi:zinc-binding alcohol dehydrogenase/oxidoreductase